MLSAGAVAQAYLKLAAMDDTVPSWEKIEVLLAQSPTAMKIESEKRERKAGGGAPNTDVETRLFGTTDKPRVIFYRDYASWCPWCQKVWFLLEEKKIPHTVVRMPLSLYGVKPAFYLEKVPSGLLPAIELDGRVITESLDIMHILESTFPENPKMPVGADRRRADFLLDHLKELYADWIKYVYQPPVGTSERELAAKFETLVDKIEAELKVTHSVWICDIPGGGPSLVDMALAPHFERMCGSVLYYKGINMRNNAKWPALNAWFCALDKTPSYVASKCDYYMNVHDMICQHGHGIMSPAGMAAAAVIDGKNGSWRLPLPPLSAESFPEPFAGAGADDVEAACHEAANKMVTNRKVLIPFTMKALNLGPSFPAPLSNPQAKPSDSPELRSAMDLCLRAIAYQMIVGKGTVATEQGMALYNSIRSNTASELVSDVKACLEHLRARVGVPRDISFPAARMLRGHVTWAIEALPL